jgi:hypothetical protein
LKFHFVLSGQGIHDNDDDKNDDNDDDDSDDDDDDDDDNDIYIDQMVISM